MKKLSIIILFIIAIVLAYFFGGRSGYLKAGRLYISEIVASNSGVIKDDSGEYSDYIEIYNGYGYDVNLKNYRLTDNIANSKKWVFPDMTIKSGEYKIIYASGKNRCNGGECHTNFKLNSEGETLVLIEPGGNAISKITYPKLTPNISYSYVDRDYVITQPTPKEKNIFKKINIFDLSKYKIIINEYITHNKGSNYASNGGYYDWVELYNTTNEDLNLEGLSLSDDEKNLNKFIFPNVVIKSKSYLVVYLTGGEKIDNEVYAPFRLSDDDKKIILSANEKVIDEVNVVKLERNMSYGRSSDKWLYYFTPTPGKDNTTKGVERWGE